MIGASSIALGGFSGVASGHSTQSGVSTINPILTPDTGVHSHENANEILIRNVGDGSGSVKYRLAVNGKLKAGDEAGENETVKRNAVEGVVAGQGRDNYFYSGRITTFEITAGADIATVFINGQRVDIDELPGGKPKREKCAEITPLSYKDQTVEEFYGYKPDLDAENPRRSNTPTNLERPGVSRLFLYEGPGGLSLVIIHGGGEDEDGGAATFGIAGLPPDGEWAVLDDSYEGSDDIFRIDRTQSVLSWAWGAGGRNDGGAFRGLGRNFRLVVQPAFNEAAEREPLGSGQVTEWQVLSGSNTDPDVISVPLDRPVVITSGNQGIC
ncbi:hypothetical protein BRC91_07540 [Halobacteriales archaeon QS_4_62_28]|nr:MAG: hypothetical protein BRC91_07540 [Halobacteriales archaeon QS_4_62_28]